MHIALLSLPANFHCRKWAQALQRAGAAVSVYSFEAGEIPGVRCVRLRAPVRWGGRYRYPSYWLTARSLARRLRRDGVDVLHPLHLTPFGTWAVRSGFRPVIAAAVGADVLEYPPAGESSPWARGRGWDSTAVERNAFQDYVGELRHHFFRRQVTEVVRRSDHLTADNLALLQALEEWFDAPREKLSLLRWGLDPRPFRQSEEEVSTRLRDLGLPPHKRLVLIPRGLRAVYQADVLMAGCQRLLQAGEWPRTHELVVLSAGYAASPAIARQAEALAAAYAPVHLLAQQLSAEDMAALWLRTDVFLNTPDYDGYSATLSEGRYAGAIPVVNDIPAHRELLQHGHNAFVVTPLTPQRVAASLRTLFGELPASLARMRARWASMPGGSGKTTSNGSPRSSRPASIAGL